MRRRLRKIGRRLLLRYRIVSTYLDGERIVEGFAITRRQAKREVEAVYRFRNDQDEGPRITFERRRAA